MKLDPHGISLHALLTYHFLLCNISLISNGHFVFVLAPVGLLSKIAHIFPTIYILLLFHFCLNLFLLVVRISLPLFTYYILQLYLQCYTRFLPLHMSTFLTNLHIKTKKQKQKRRKFQHKFAYSF